MTCHLISTEPLFKLRSKTLFLKCHTFSPRLIKSMFLHRNLQVEYDRLKQAHKEQVVAPGLMEPDDLDIDSRDSEMIAEAKLLRQHKGRLEARMQILEDHNRQLEAQLQRLRQLLDQVRRIRLLQWHHMSAVASQITINSIVFSTACSRQQWRKKSKVFITGPLWENPPGTGWFPSQMASNVENIYMPWCRHDTGGLLLCFYFPTHIWEIPTVLILGLHPANERWRYKVTPSLIGWAQT